jgi:hypothetical protein
MIAVALAVSVFCSGAAAQRVPVGSPLHLSFSGNLCTSPTGTWANATLGEPGAHVSSPVDGTVVRWTMFGNYSKGKPFELRILRPAAGGAYTGAGTSAAETPSGGFVSYRTELPIKAGDLIGVDVNDGCIGASAFTGSDYLNWFPALPDGATLVDPYPGDDVEIGLSAVVQPTPTVTSLGSTGSPLGGGGLVAIHGTDFESASAVSFGGVPSPNFSVDYESQITAVIPPATKPGPVPVSVTTIAGTATAPQQFAYQGCVVPALKGDTVAAARRAVAASGCTVGRVTKRPARKRRGKKKAKPAVVAQSRAPGTVLPAGGKVDLTVKG